MSNEEHATTTGTEELRRLFHRAMKSLTPNGLRPLSPCPDSETMVSYVTGTVLPNVQKRINAHLAFCDTCWDDYAALAGPEVIANLVRSEGIEENVSLPAAIRDAKEKWSQRVARAKEFAIDLGRTYGPGALIGSVKILSEVPLVARGATEAYTLSKVIEVSVADNVYGIEIRDDKEGLLFDVAGYKVSQMIPMGVAIQSESEETLAEAKTDKYGNARFVLSRDKLGNRELFIVFGHNEDIGEVVVFLRVPDNPSPYLAIPLTGEPSFTFSCKKCGKTGIRMSL